MIEMKQKQAAIKIAVFNQKGGVGKTTFTFNAASIMAKVFKKKVLVVDADPQKNLSTTALGENIREWAESTNEDFFDKHLTVGDCLLNDKNVNEGIIKSKVLAKNGGRCKWRGVDVLPSKRSLAAIEGINTEAVSQMMSRIRATKKHCYEYDIILVDMPPYLSELSIGFLGACDYVVVPATVDKDSLDGYSELLDTIQNLKDTGINPNIQSLGVFLTMIDANTKYDKDKYLEIKEALEDNMFDVPIRRDTKVKWASDYSCPLTWFKRQAPVTKDFEVVTAEILKKVGLLEEKVFDSCYAETVNERMRRYYGY